MKILTKFFLLASVTFVLGSEGKAVKVKCPKPGDLHFTVTDPSQKKSPIIGTGSAEGIPLTFNSVVDGDRREDLTKLSLHRALIVNNRAGDRVLRCRYFQSTYGGVWMDHSIAGSLKNCQAAADNQSFTCDMERHH